MIMAGTVAAYLVVELELTAAYWSTERERDREAETERDTYIDSHTETEIHKDKLAEREKE